MIWIPIIVLGIIVAFIGFLAVLSFKILMFAIGIALVVLAIAVVLLPAIGMAVCWGRDLRAPTSSRRIARLILTGVAAAALLTVDVVWILHGLHWANVPLLAFALIGAATGGLALLQEPVAVWVETPVSRDVPRPQ